MDLKSLYKMYRYGVGIVFPPRCVVCDEILDSPEELIHEKCKSLIFPVEGSCCMHCGRKLALTRAEYCPECDIKMKKKLITFKQGKSLFQYVGAIKESMYLFKYANRREYGDFFAKTAADKWGDWIKSMGVEAIVPVPMFKRKEKKRGYNQAMTFARALSRETGIPVCSRMVKRTVDTKPMKGLGYDERVRNLKTAFEADHDILNFSIILLVDDIYTTGTTADVISELLIKSGVRQIFFLSICTGKEI